MSTDEENKIEVIDPTDPRYNDDEHFHQNRYDDNKSNHQVYTYGCTHTGCGCSIGCSTLMLISLIITMFIYWLF